MLVIAYSTLASYVEPDFANQLEDSRPVWIGETKDTSIFQNISELCFSASQALGTNRADVLDHLRATQRLYFLEVPQDRMVALEDWAAVTSSLLLAGGKLLDPHGYSLASEGSSVPMLPERLSRAQKWRSFLTKRGVSVQETIRPVRAVDEVVPQLDQVVGLRTLSLALCVTAQYLTAENLETPDNHTFPRALAAMTPS